MAFISCRSRPREENGKGGGASEISVCRYQEMSGLKYELVCCFEFAADMVGGDIKELS